MKRMASTRATGVERAIDAEIDRRMAAMESRPDDEAPHMCPHVPEAEDRGDTLYIGPGGPRREPQFMCRTCARLLALRDMNDGRPEPPPRTPTNVVALQRPHALADRRPTPSPATPPALAQAGKPATPYPCPPIAQRYAESAYDTAATPRTMLLVWCVALAVSLAVVGLVVVIGIEVAEAVHEHFIPTGPGGRDR